MYGTIARLRANPANLPALHALAAERKFSAGEIERLIFQMDADPEWHDGAVVHRTSA